MMVRASLLIILLFSLLTSSCAKDKEYRIQNSIARTRPSFGYVIVMNNGNKLGTGSGVVVYHDRKHSFVLSAGHMCDDPQYTYEIQDYKGNKYTAIVEKFKLERIGRRRDLCLFKTNKRVPHAPITIAWKEPQWGDKVWNLNATLGDFAPKTKKNHHGMTQIHTGWFSGFRPDMNRYTFTQLGVLPGASGSMVLNKRGQLISIITSYRGGTGFRTNEISFGMSLPEIREFLKGYIRKKTR